MSTFNIDNITLTREEAENIVRRAAWCADNVDLADEFSDYGCVWDGDGAALYGKAFDMINPVYTYGVCRGRHEMPVDDYIFEEITEPMNFIMGLYATAAKKIPQDATRVAIYVTGLTQATLAITAVCATRNIELWAYHYDKETGEYKPQRVLKRDWHKV